MAKILILILLSLTLNAEFIVKSYQEIRNKNVVRQNYEESCGASSIATLVNLLDNKKLTELDVLKQFTLDENNTLIINTDMVSFAELKTVVDKLGYTSNGYQIDRTLFNKIRIPILVKIESDPRYPHFVIAINYDGNFIKILDPSYGEYLSSKKEFYSVWDRYDKGGYALIIAPNSNHTNLNITLPNKHLFENRPFKFY
ncbi:peptidase C39 [Campylobacter fetus subsp. testudinum]|uniref:cysteine peptidase family C39 domain-containing protein n=1 Tax=Campylobacter fetus TaxID=196 RepID=UPI000818A29F|nr:cysteine peptidase family C39 domain-containing protein [Campylobacter fetus]OCR98892.1 peptidase C39 [Campylobacter fetus subsp. testudinum]